MSYRSLSGTVVILECKLYYVNLFHLQPTAYVSVVANSKSLFNVTYSADSLESTLSLYDQGMEYDIEG